MFCKIHSIFPFRFSQWFSVMGLIQTYHKHYIIIYTRKKKELGTKGVFLVTHTSEV